tara:strand:- start:5120 stop:5812 length:693 start_codon:yes stop_codon:yes gene_type:complete
MNVEIMVIAGGKCGSTTLKETFRHQNYITIKSHNPWCFKNQFGYDGFFETIKKSSKHHELIIVDAYRTPIERKISSFFHNGERKIPNFLNLTTEEQINIFNSDHIYRIEEQHIIHEVFKRLQLPDTKKYNFKKKYLYHKHNNIVFIKLHYNDIKNWDKRLTSIFSKTIPIVSDNVSSNKPYYEKYKQFLKEYKVPKKYLEGQLLNDKEFKIYQTPLEQQQYIDKWLQKSY